MPRDYEIESELGLHRPTDRKSKVSRVALMALTIHRFMDLMFEEVEKAGFQGLEFLTKSEFFLRAITPVYSKQNFNQVLDVLEQVDARFPETRFYYGLKALRSLCTQEGGQETIDMVQPSGKTVEESIQSVDEELVFFTAFLVENIIRYIQQLRKSRAAANMNIEEMRHQIDDTFDDCVLSTVTSFTAH